jgi:hypothetical protein
MHCTMRKIEEGIPGQAGAGKVASGRTPLEAGFHPRDNVSYDYEQQALSV